MKSKKWALTALLAVGLVLGGLSMSGAYRAGAYPQLVPDKSKQEDATKSRPAGKGSSITRREEEKNLRKTIQAYSEALTQGNLEAVLGFWTEDAEYVNESGTVLRGRETLRSIMKRSLSEHKGSKQTIKVDSLRFIRPDVISEHGTIFLTAPDGSVEKGRYCALWAKQGGKWLISTVRDLPDPAQDDQPAAARLKSLAWMIGEWEEKGGKSEVHLTCKWGPNQTFLIQEFTARRADGSEATATQRVGWDAHHESIRSWVFDSSGGFGESFWTRQGNSWELQCEGVRPDGRVRTSRDHWKFIDNDTAEWSSTDREANEAPLPDLNVTFVRKTKDAK